MRFDEFESKRDLRSDVKRTTRNGSNVVEILRGGVAEQWFRSRGTLNIGHWSLWMSESEVVIRLTVPEAVVLDGLLRRFSDTDRLTIEDQAEQRALWNLQCLFEREGDPSWPSLETARSALRDQNED